jgi:hypothetical protein
VLLKKEDSPSIAKAEAIFSKHEIKEDTVEGDSNVLFESFDITWDGTVGEYLSFLNNENREGTVCSNIILPNGQVIKGPWTYGANNTEEIKEYDNWISTLKNVFSQNSDCRIFDADCHF